MVNNKFLKKNIIFLFAFLLGGNIKSYSDNINSEAKYFLPGMTDFIEVYYASHYNFPENVDSLLSFYYYIENKLDEDYWSPFIKNVLPFLLAEKENVIIVNSSDSMVMYINDTEKVCTEHPGSWPVCEYIETNNREGGDTYSSFIHENIICYNSANRSVILGEERELFHKTLRSFLREQQLEVLTVDKKYQYAIYDFSLDNGLKSFCDNQQIDFTLDIYDNLTEWLTDFCKKHGFVRIIFCNYIFI